MIKVTPVAETRSKKKTAEKWKSRLERRQGKGILANTAEVTVPQEERLYILGVDDEELR
jgi:tRNA(Ile2) C34 agmatinyltransferase TiaS